MAFFGLTYLGYQSPIGDRMLSSAQNKRDVRDVSVSQSQVGSLPPINTKRALTYADRCGGGYSLDPDAHQNQGQYKQMIRRAHINKSPRDLYRVPLTDNQQYGWWVPTGGHKNQEPWITIRRFPHKNSEMTKFVNQMSMTHSDFSLF